MQASMGGADPARGRSRTRATPSELLARKQQLLEQGELAAQPEAADGPASIKARLDGLLGRGQQLLEASPGRASRAEPSQNADDLYILLAKKEDELQLAAELGKLLLEANEKLSKENERIANEYARQLELFAQDKHREKQELVQLVGDHENRLIELQTDCNILKNQLEEQQQVARKSDKEKSKLIDDLVQQNQRLTGELVEATRSEEQLSSQLEQMNERFNMRIANRQDHVAQIETLKDEIQIVNQRKQELERRLKLAQQDKSGLGAALDGLGDKVLILENAISQKELQLAELEAEVLELRDSSSWLSAELESLLSLNERLCGAPNGQAEGQQLAGLGATTNELRMVSQRKRSLLVEQLKKLRLRQRTRLRANELRLVQLESASSASSAAGAARGEARAAPSRRGSSSLFREIEEEDEEEEAEEAEEEEEPVSSDDGRGSPGLTWLEPQWTAESAQQVWALVRKLQLWLENRRHQLRPLVRSGSQRGRSQAGSHLYSASSAEDSGISASDDSECPETTGSGPASSRQLAHTTNHKPNPLVGPAELLADARPSEPSELVASWRKLVASVRQLLEEMPCPSCQLMIGERADYEQLRKRQASLSEEAKRQAEQVLALQASQIEREAELAKLEERCQILSHDLSNCDKPKEEIVRLAWRARDQAVERKNGAEIALAKTRIENMQISSQLMEVVQQKGQLSLKLAQFEDDIHYITQDSVKAKFTWEEYAERQRNSKTARRPPEPASPLLSHLLLGFSMAAGGSQSTGNSANSLALAAQNNQQQQRLQEQHQLQSSAMDNGSQPASLIRNFTSNRFNLRFWQRSPASQTNQSSSEKAELQRATVGKQRESQQRPQHPAAKSRDTSPAQPTGFLDKEAAPPVGYKSPADGGAE